jgi:ComF family protein
MECNTQNIWRGFVNLIFPPRCSSCGEKLDEDIAPPFCKPCLAQFRFLTTPLCPCCGHPYVDKTSESHLCQACLLAQPPFVAARFVASYEGILQNVLHRFKYGGDTSTGEALGEIMANFSWPLFEIKDYSMIIPVPLHVKRLRERGFNQALILAKVIAKQHRLKLDYLSFKRTKLTPPQTTLGRHARQDNVKGVFTVVHPEKLRQEKIILVDDVYTTGSTLIECAQTLKEAEVAAIAVLTMARTPE